jgi:Flp pilus assembly protein TadD
MGNGKPGFVPISAITAIAREEPAPLADFWARESSAEVRSWRLAREARKQRSAGDPGPAMERLREAIELNRENWAAWYDLGVCLDETGKGAESLKYFQQSVAIEPGYVESRYSLGLVHLKEGRNAEAEASLREAVRLDASYAKAHAMLGVVLFRSGRTDEALTEAEEAVRLDPEAPEVNNLIVFYRETGENERALKFWQGQQFADPKSAIPWREGGNLLLDADRFEDAASSFREALRLDPEDALAWRGVVVCMAGRKRVDEAPRMVETRLREKPGDEMAARLKELLQDLKAAQGPEDARR